MNFFYSFTETLLHSLWQSALLFLLSFFLSLSFKSLHPLYKRNLFYSVIGLQIVVSFCTFLYCYSSYSFTQWLTANNISILNAHQHVWLQSNAVLIFSIYLAIVCVRLFSMWLQWNKFKRFYIKALIKPSASVKIFTQAKAFHLGIKRSISIWYSQNIVTPVTFGFLKPVILLPFSLVNNITNEEAESIILHELAHVKNNDYLLNWLLIVVETMYFFNPFIKILTNKIKKEREKNCDVQVINFGYDPLLYAQTLLKVAKNNNHSPAFQLAAAKKTTQLLHRITFFTDERKLNFKRVSPVFISFVFLLSIFLCLLPFMRKDVEKNNTITAAKNIGISTPSNNEYIPENGPALAFENKGIETKKIIQTEEVCFEEPYSLQSTSIELDKNVDEEIITLPENIFSTVAYNQTADSTKEVTINIETQQGKITKLYKLSLVNGKWIVQPQWMLVEKNADSTSIKLRDSLFNKIDSIQ
jgi:beta-lactamase regulating signal transducer with metallopeptidase domain